MIRRRLSHPPASRTAAITPEALETRVLMAATLPAGFQESIYTTGFDTPTAQAFAPDGRLFVLEKNGKVRVVTAAGALNSTPFLSLSVDTSQDRGLVALAFDPNFASNRYLYLWYTKTDTAGTRNRLSRVTASATNPNVAQAGSELVLLEVPHGTNIHTGGAMGFGADGMLYLGVGDGGQSTNAQNLADLRGKVLRLNVANPSNMIPADNPYAYTAGARKEIYAIGLRNPFTGQVKPGTNSFYVNDVGETQWEEVNVIAAGKNYGWPTAEGVSSNPAFTNPLHAYSHAGFSNAAITGAAFYTGSQFPADYLGSYFFADYLNGFMRRVDAAGNAHGFGTNVAGPLDIDMGPDGSLYYISAYGNGFEGANRPIYKISFAAGANRAPAAVAAATTPTSGAAVPLTVGFTGNGSTDPDGDSLTYTWNFGDGATGTGKDVSHAYATRGTYFATLTVSDGRGGTNTSQPIRVDAGNAAPTGTIATPSEGLKYTAGQTINFSGSGTDPEDGALAASRLSWMVYLVHNTHEHQFAGPFNGVAGGSFVVPTNGHVENDHHYRIELTVTDSAGLSRTTSRTVNPVVSTVTVTTNVAGLSVALDGQPRVGPFASGSLVGATRTLSAPATQTLNGVTYEFVSWSDGGAAAHNVTVAAANATYTATYRVAAPTLTKLGATADAFVRDGISASQNFGTSGDLTVQKYNRNFNSQSYLKFDTTAVAGNGAVTSVKLRLYGKLASGSNVVTDVYGTATGWTESGIKWNNKPAATTASRIGRVTVANNSAKWYEFDVTSYVNAERAAGRNVVGFVLINPNTASFATVFSSRNKSTNKPELVVTQSATPPVPTQTPFGGTPIALPGGTIQAEDFDNGGEGVAYHDANAASEGDAPAYRGGTGVDVEVTGAGGYNVGWVRTGEWLEYTVNVTAAGTYNFEARVASLGIGGQFSVLLDGTTIAGGIAVPDTGGYQTYQTVTRTGVSLPAGQHVLRINADSEGAAGFTGNIDWFRFVAPAVPTAPAAPSGLAASATSATQVNLAWTDNSNNETGFKLERKTGSGGTWAQIATVTGTSYSDAGRAAGTLYVYRVRATNAVGDSAYSNESSVTTPSANPTQSPFGGTAWPVPGLIEAEHFDEGGEGVAFHDSDALNEGGVPLRPGTGVDVEPAADDAGGGNNVGYVKAGEWLEYTVNVAATGDYNFDIRVASGNPGGTFHIEIDGVDKTGALTLPYTGSWTTWQTVTASGINLTAGTHVMRVAFDASNLPGGDIGRLNWVRVTAAVAATQSPFSGTPIAVPGRIQAENFDNGGEGVAYHDVESADRAGVGYRQSGVEIELSGDAGGGHNVGWMKTGEWLEYTIDIAVAGTYTLGLRVASLGAGGSFSVAFDGVDKTGPIAVPDTGGWQSYTTVNRTVTLLSGRQVMRVLVTGEGATGFAGNLNYIDLTPA